MRHAMKHGTVKWFNEFKGYGFITPEGNSPDDLKHDVFVHYAVIETPGFKFLTQGEYVTYESTDDHPKGPIATHCWKGVKS